MIVTGCHYARLVLTARERCHILSSRTAALMPPSRLELNMSIPSRPSKIPGHNERCTTRQVTSKDGRVWPRNTWFKPQYAGNMGQVVLINGETVTF